MAKRTGKFQLLAGSLDSALSKTTRKPRDYSDGVRLWRGLQQLQGLGLLEYQQLRICCPYCLARRKSCDVCDGSGYVCPTCTGQRYLAEHREGDSSLMVRCKDCGVGMSGGWVYDFDSEVAAVRRWLDEWARGLHPFVPKPPLEKPYISPGPVLAPPAEVDALVRAKSARLEALAVQRQRAAEDAGDLGELTF